MRIRTLLGAFLLFSSGQVQAQRFPTLQNTAESPLCEQDLTERRLPGISGIFAQPKGIIERGLRPAAQHVQAEVCRCLPRRIRHQPLEVRVALHIEPNAGKIRVQYHIEPPWSRPMYRMVQCLGEPTLKVEPMAYASDIITAAGRAEELLGYFILVDLEEGVHRSFWPW